MRILYVITGLHRGGAEGQLLELCPRMKRRGHQLHVVSALPLSGYADDIAAMGIPVSSLEIPLGSLSPLAVPRLARLIWSFRPDVVHSFMVHSNLLTRVVRALAPEPVLVNTALGISESQTPRHSSRPRELAYTVTDFLADVTTQVSRACADRYVEVHAVPRRKMRVVPCGVDANRFVALDEAGRRAARAEFSLPDDGRFTWLCVARFTPDKDHRTLLEAFVEVVAREPNTRLVLKGVGPLEPDVRYWVRELGLERSVSILTARVAMERLLNAGDAFVLSSVREGLPTVLLEAAACGLPLVATDVGGNGEVASAATGRLVPARAPGALAEAMLAVQRLPEVERRRQGHAGRALVEATYDLERVVTEYEGLYAEYRTRKGLAA